MPKVMEPDFPNARMFQAAIPLPPKISFIPSETFGTKEDPERHLLAEVARRDNSVNEGARIRLIYVNEDRGRSNWFEHGNYILTFRLEGPITSVLYRLVAEFAERRQHRRWRVRPAASD